MDPRLGAPHRPPQPGAWAAMRVRGAFWRSGAGTALTRRGCPGRADVSKPGRHPRRTATACARCASARPARTWRPPVGSARGYPAGAAPSQPSPVDQRESRHRREHEPVSAVRSPRPRRLSFVGRAHRRPLEARARRRAVHAQPPAASSGSPPRSRAAYSAAAVRGSTS